MGTLRVSVLAQTRDEQSQIHSDAQEPVGDRRSTSRSYASWIDGSVQCVALDAGDAGFNYWSSSASLRALRIIGPNTNRAITRMMSHSQITATTQLVGTRRVSSSNQDRNARIRKPFCRDSRLRGRRPFFGASSSQHAFQGVIPFVASSIFLFPPS